MEGLRGRPQAPGGGPWTGRVEKPLAVPFHQVEEVKRFLIMKLVSKYQSTWTTSVAEHPGRDSPLSSPGLQVKLLGLARGSPPSGLQSPCTASRKPDPPPGDNDLPTKGARPGGSGPRDGEHTLGAAATPGRRPGAGAARGWERREDVSHGRPGPDHRAIHGQRLEEIEEASCQREEVCAGRQWGLGSEGRASEATSRSVPLWRTVGATEGSRGG